MGQGDQTPLKLPLPIRRKKTKKMKAKRERQQLADALRKAAELQAKLEELDARAKSEHLVNKAAQKKPAPEVAPPKPEVVNDPPQVDPTKLGFEHDPTASVSIGLHDPDDPGMVRCNKCLQPVEQNRVKTHRKGAHSFTCKLCNCIN